MAVSLHDRAVSLTAAITLWLSVATALPATAQPEGPSTTDRGLCQVIVAAPDRPAGSEFARHGFAIDAIGDRAVTAVADADDLARWIPISPGSYMLRALAFDAGTNRGASEPLPIIAQASLYFPIGPDWTFLGVPSDKQAQPL